LKKLFGDCKIMDILDLYNSSSQGVAAEEKMETSGIPRANGVDD
jgi:hypothetical protein